MDEEIKKIESDDIRDVLAETLYNAIKNGVPVKDDETGKVYFAPASAAILAVARAYVKDNPPKTLPTPQSPSGKLAAFGASRLPFAAKETH